jgi:MFS family permease
MQTDRTRHSLRYFNYFFSLRGVFENLCAGNTLLFVSFALATGVSRERIGIISAAASVACIVQMLALFLANRIRHKKRFFLLLSFIEPLLMMAAVLTIPFLPAAWRFPFLISAVFLAAATLHLTKPFTDGWMAAIIPAGIRGRYIGLRTQWLTISTILSTLAAGFLLQYCTGGAMLPIAVILVIGALFGVLAVMQLRTIEMPALAATSHVTMRDIWSVISGHYRPFTRYLLGMLIFLCPFYLAIPYYQVYYLRILEMPAGIVALMQCGYFVVKIVMMPYCGRWVDRYGVRTALLTAGIIYTVFYAGFPLNQTGCYWPLLLCWMLVAPADGLYGVAITSALYSSVPDTPNRSVFFAVSNLVALGGYAIGALIAIPILALLRPVQWTWGPFAIGQFQAYYGLCALLMAGCTLSSFWIAPARGKGNS